MAVTSVASVTTAGGVDLLAAASWSSGAAITNTDANVLYILFGPGTASATNYSVKLATDDYYEVPAWVPRGAQIKGIWAADGSGVALITAF